MTEEQAKSLVEDRIAAFAKAVKSFNLQDIPHIMLVFDDECRAVYCGSTPHFHDPLARIAILMDVIKEEIRKLQTHQAKTVDESLLMNIFKGRTPVA